MLGSPLIYDAEEVRATLARLPNLLPRYGLASIAVFGSVARGQATPESDVVLLVTFGRPTGAFAVTRRECELEELLGRRVEIVNPAALKPRLSDRVIAEAVHAA